MGSRFVGTEEIVSQTEVAIDALAGAGGADRWEFAARVMRAAGDEPGGHREASGIGARVPPSPHPPF